MPVLIRSRSDFNPRGTPVLQVTFRRRPCGNCGRKAHVTLFSTTVFYSSNLNAGLVKGMGGEDRGPFDGQCCIRCTRGLRSRADHERKKAPHRQP